MPFPTPRLCSDSQNAFSFMRLIDAPVCLDSLGTAKLPHCLLKSLTLSLVLEPIWKRIYKPLAKPEHGTFDIPLYSSEWFMHVSFPCYSEDSVPFFKSINLKTLQEAGEKAPLVGLFHSSGLSLCLNFGLFFCFMLCDHQIPFLTQSFTFMVHYVRKAWDAEWNYYFEVKKSDFFELMLFNNHTWIILLVLYLELEKD